MQNDPCLYPAFPDIDVWLTCYQEIGDPDLLARLGQLLDLRERAQQQRFHFADDRLRYLITRAMVRIVLSRYAPVEPANWKFAVNDYGRPEVASLHATPGLRFNISHSVGMIALAVSRQRMIGIDIENVAVRPTPLDLAEHFFASEEVADLASLPQEQRHARFYEYWTLKESYIKARGMGLSLPLNSFHFSFPGQARVRLTVNPESGDDATCWQFWQCRPAPNYLMALCAERTGAVAPSIVVHSLIPGVEDKPVDIAWATCSG